MFKTKYIPMQTTSPLDLLSDLETSELVISQDPISATEMFINTPVNSIHGGIVSVHETPSSITESDVLLSLEIVSLDPLTSIPVDTALS